jgi:hypothetical protein
MEEKMTIEELGQFIRSKNPQEFSEFTDQQIGERVLERNPEYWQYIKTNTVLQNPTLPSTKEQISNYLFFGLIIITIISVCYIAYKIGKLIIKAYRKADHWLEKTES